MGLNLGKLSGDDANFTDRKSRGYNFSTPLTEIAAMLEWNMLSPLKADGSSRKVIPYFFGGLGVALTNPNISFNESAAANSSATVKSNIASDKANLKKATLAIPLGAGFKFPMPKGTLGVELGFRPTTSDYLDGISKAGNPNKRDWYAVGGINYAFHFGDAKKNNDASIKKNQSKDSDGDGIVDELDKCPTISGLSSNGGCPVLSNIDQQTIKEAIANVNFKTASADLTNESLPILDKIADILTRNSYYQLSVEGHTDSQGNEASNLTLSKARAASCVNYLLSKGIASNRMTSNGFGSSRPIAGNDTEDGRRKNRRVEFNLSVN